MTEPYAQRHCGDKEPKDSLGAEWDDDPGEFFGNSNAGGKGYWFALAYMLAGNMASSLTYCMKEFDGRNDNADYDRLQADIALRF